MNVKKMIGLVIAIALFSQMGFADVSAEVAAEEVQSYQEEVAGAQDEMQEEILLHKKDQQVASEENTHSALEQN